MSKITIIDKIVYGFLSIFFSITTTSFLIIPLLFRTIGQISKCGFPDGPGSCASQILTLLSWPIISIALGIFTYEKIMIYKRNQK